MTTGYVKKMTSIKDWNWGRTGYQLKIQGMCTYPAFEGILMKWEDTAHLLWVCIVEVSSYSLLPQFYGHISG